MRVILLGNAGSGKSTMARRLCAVVGTDVARLYGLVPHRALYEGFAGRKRQYTRVEAYDIV